MPYMTERELMFRVGPRGLRGLGVDAVSQPDDDGEKMPYRVTSTDPNSLFNGAAWDPNKMVHIKTIIDYQGVKIELDIPFKEFLVPFDVQQLVDAQKAVPPPANATNAEKFMFGLTQSLRGTRMNYQGFCIAAPFAKRLFAVDPRLAYSRITGTVEFLDPRGAVIAALKYYWGRMVPPPATSTTTRLPGMDALPFGTAATTTATASKAAAANLALWAGREYLKDVFAKFIASGTYECQHVTPGGKKQALPAGQPEISWECMPTAVKQAVEDFYNVMDPQVLVEQGYSETDATAEVLNRAKLRGQFPIDEAVREFQRKVYDDGLGHETGEVAYKVSGADGNALINKAIDRAPQDGFFFVLSTDVDAVLAAVKAKLGKSDADAREMVRQTLALAIAEIERVEVRRFNWLYYRYLQVSANMPASWVNFCVYAYNKRKEQAAKAAAKQGQILNVLSTVMSFVPVVGLPFSLAMQAAGGYSNIQSIKAQAESAKEERKDIQAEIAKTEEVIRESQEAQQVIADQRQAAQDEKKKKTAKVVKGVGIAAGIAAVIAAGVNALGNR